MPVVVRNERPTSFYFTDANKKKTPLDPGVTATLSDEEWGQVPIAIRGAGGINPLSPTDADSSSMKGNFEYYQPFGTVQLRYYGVNEQTAADSDPTWLIRRFDHVQVTVDDIRVSQIQILDQVAWSNRASLAWT